MQWKKKEEKDEVPQLELIKLKLVNIFFILVRHLLLKINKKIKTQNKYEWTPSIIYNRHFSVSTTYISYKFSPETSCCYVSSDWKNLLNSSNSTKNWEKINPKQHGARHTLFLWILSITWLTACFFFSSFWRIPFNFCCFMLLFLKSCKWLWK